ncbi:VapC toxin family PIN domain ribonuclease [Pyrococcus woesei]|uniref:VapC toxin family PIN domain ribonuclease n=1 Tax=Pyrococcus woesei TaxID=2262 RepID=UPI0019947FBE|nr:VapC toxin family PIN domain ribonuclease [Methanomassiliicoccales archaeon]
MKMPKRIMFDSSSLLIMHMKRNKSLLELTLLNFEVLVPQISIYEYLVTKAFLGKNLDHEMALLKEIYQIIPLEDEVLTKSAVIMKNLMKNREKISTIDVLVGVAAIVKNALLITDDPSRYKPLTKYGLDVISIEKFAEELNLLAIRLSKKDSVAKVIENQKSVRGDSNG